LSLLQLGCTWLKPGVNEKSLAFVREQTRWRCEDIFRFRDPPETETSKPFLEHLEDLRWTIVKMAITLRLRWLFVSRFARRWCALSRRRLTISGHKSERSRRSDHGLDRDFISSGVLRRIVLSFPLLLYFLAEFVLPALTAVEKRFLFPAIAVSFALFLLGVLVCYFWLLPKTILFFFRDTESLGWAPTWTVQQYYSFVTRFTIGFGLAFELPVVVLALVDSG
jgi:sec-independent protein translocase protein TatC